MRVCLVSDHTMTFDRRILRHVRTLRATGHEVTVVALADADGREPPDLHGATLITVPSFGGLDVTNRIRGNAPREGSRPSSSAGGILRRSLTRAVSRLSRFLGPHRYIRRGVYLARRVVPTRPDVCHANNLAPLPAALACKLLFGTKVIYDAHELEAERPGWSKLACWRARVVERACIRHADHVVAVSEGRGAYMAGMYRIPPPTIIRNTPEQPRPDVLADARRSHDGAPPTVMYVGAVAIGRGLTQLVDVLPVLPDVRAVLVGPDMGLVGDLARRGADLGVSDRLEIRPPVPPDDVATTLLQADVGYCAFENICASYYFNLPNKIFEYLLSGLPVVASDLPELRAFLSGTGAGALFDPGSRDELAEAISRLLREDQQALRSRALRLGRDNTWETEQKRLVALYDALGRGPKGAEAPTP
jgi:glycosyltransferase involved in cell wall biosynthesis